MRGTRELTAPVPDSSGRIPARERGTQRLSYAHRSRHTALTDGRGRRMTDDRELGESAEYAPQHARPYWGHIGRFTVDAAVDAAAVMHLPQRDLMVWLTPLTLWCWQTACVPLERDRVFSYKTIDLFVSTGADSYVGRSRSTLRSRLLRISESLLDARPRHVPRVIGKHDRLRPYSRAETAQLASWAKTLSTEQRRSSATNLLALGFGAGLATREILTARASDIIVVGEDALVHVPGEDERIVPIQMDWKPYLEVPAESDPLLFRPRRATISESQVTDFVLATRTDLDVKPGRMRATWLLRMLQVGTPALELLELSGMKNFAALDRYHRYLDMQRSEG